MFLPEAGLHLAVTFLFLLLWAALRRRPSTIGRILDTSLTAVVVGFACTAAIGASLDALDQ